MAERLNVTRNFSTFFAFFIYVYYTKTVLAKVDVNVNAKLDVIEYTSNILCISHLKFVHVYFENDTSIGYPGQILQTISKCGISYISLRNNFKRSPLEAISDDGILMYLVLILQNGTQPIELTLIKKKSAAKHLTFVILLISDATDISKTWLRNAFKKFWHQWLLNVVIIFWRNNQPNIYRYNPFKNDYLIQISFDTRVPRIADLFVAQKKPDLRRKPLRMCLYGDGIRTIFQPDGNITGPDGFLTRFVANQLNATLVVDRRSLFAQYSSSIDICFDEIAQEVDDVAMNLRFLAPATFQKFAEYTVIQNRDDLCVLVPKAKIATTIWNLFRPFDWTVWLAILMSVLLTYCLLNIIFRDTLNNEAIFMQLLASILTMPLSKIPAHYSMRLFIFCWFFYGMLISTAFRGNLTTNLLFHKYLPDIDTIMDLGLSKYRILLFSRHTKHITRFLNRSNIYEKMVMDKMQVVPDEIVWSSIAANNLSFAYLQKHHISNFHANARDHVVFGQPLYHVMSNCLVPFYTVYIVPYGSPYLGFLNNLVRSAQEFGLNIYWKRLTRAALIKSGKTLRRRNDDDDDAIVLKFEHLKAAFGLFALGLVIAFVVFLGEIYIEKRKSGKWKMNIFC